MSTTTTIIFVHGFMGSEATFKSLPAELVELLQGAFPTSKTIIRTELFIYDSKGKDNSEKLYNFILNLPGDDVHIVGHSMGGILALDCMRIKNKTPLAKLKGVISIDTPYWSLSKDVSDISSHVPEPLMRTFERASTSPGWGFFAAATAVAAGAMLASSASLKARLYDTVDFLGPLWNIEDMDTRFSILKERPDLYFAGIFLKLKNGTTFTNPPPFDLQHHFQVLQMNVPTSVVEAHVHMFDAAKDADAYSEILIMVMQCLKESISRCS